MQIAEAMKISKLEKLMVLTVMVGVMFAGQIKADEIDASSDDFPLLDGYDKELENFLKKMSKPSQVKMFIQDQLRYYPLHQAVYFGNCNEVQRLLKSGKYSVTDTMAFGVTPLHVCYHSVAVAELLWSHGADINASTEQGETPLHYISGAYYTDSSTTDMVMWLLKKNMKMIHATSQYGTTPLHAAASSGNSSVVKLLIRCGASVNGKDKEGNTPLHLAAMDGGKGYKVLNIPPSGKTRDTILALLEGNADVLSLNNKGQTPAAIAIENDNSEAAELILGKQ